MTDKGTVLLVRFDTQESELRTPLGLLYVASALLQAGFRPRIYHEVGGRRNVERLVRLVQETRPLLVGYSIETSPGILDCVRAATAIAATSATPSVWGGIHASSLRDQTARHPAVDYVVVGEGEETIVDLARHLQGGGGTAGARHIPGLAFVDGEEYVETLQRPFIRDLDRYSLPFELVDMDRYLRAYGSRWLSLFTSRGCPFRCGFCYIVATGNNKLREHSPEFVLDQVRWLKSRYAVEGINFFDDEFFLNKKRSMWLGARLDVAWTAFPRISDLKEKLVAELARTRCQLVHTGAESGNDRILKFIEKGHRVDDIRRAAELLDRYHIGTRMNFICGFPTETWSETLDTVDLMRELRQTYPRILYRGPKMYTPYPNTPLFDHAVRLGFRPPTTLEGWSGFTRQRCNLPYVARRNELESLYFYYHQAYPARVPRRLRKRIARTVVRPLARWRWERHRFSFPVEYLAAKLQHRILGSLARA